MVNVVYNETQVADFNKKLESAISMSLDEFVRIITERIESRAKTVHRYESRTGNLQRATKSSTINKQAEIYIDKVLAKYGSYVHDGTKKWQPDTFIADAIEYVLSQSTEEELNTLIEGKL
jgi:hypothetical protein